MWPDSYGCVEAPSCSREGRKWRISELQMSPQDCLIYKAALSRGVKTPNGAGKEA